MSSEVSEFLQETRRKRLRKLIDEKFFGVASNLARRMNCQPAHISKLLNGQATFGERSARKIEEYSKLTPGWLDINERAEQDDFLQVIRKLIEDGRLDAQKRAVIMSVIESFQSQPLVR